MGEPLIVLREVWKVYEHEGVRVEALRGASLEVEAGESVAIMGASGSGKSTCLHVLGCLDRPTRGEHRFAGREIGTLAADVRAEIRSREIGFVFQSFNLIPRTSAAENVELPLVYAGVARAEHRPRALALLRSMGLEGREHHLPSQLSGGQQQRVAIARALANRPAVLLADEPTGNLDSRSSADILAIFQRLNRGDGLTLLVVTHEPDVAAHFARVVAFRDGEIVSDVRQQPLVAEPAPAHAAAPHAGPAPAPSGSAPEPAASALREGAA